LAALTDIVRPDIAVITKIAPAHLAHFKSVDAIAEAKAEILEGIDGGGVAILPRDSKYYDMLAERSDDMMSFGWHKDADMRIVETELTASGSRSIFQFSGERIVADLPLPGKHWVENAACVLLVAMEARTNVGDALTALKNMDKLQGRGEVHALNITGKSITLIDESYNANPESMAAAIAVLGLAKGRKIAVLGDMLELGENENALHAGLLEQLLDAKINQVVTCGARMKNLHDALPNSMNAGWFSNHADCLSGLDEQLQNGDTLMIKGSNASGMGELVASLKNKNNNKEYVNVL